MCKKSYRAFYNQRDGAKRRGILFQFTYQEWCDWWLRQLGPDWLELRGCRRGKFVMARYKDTGPYAPHNVECITHDQNNRDQAKNGLAGFVKGKKPPPNAGAKRGRRHPNAGRKITFEDACYIRCAAGTQRSLAKRFGVSERLIRLIKNNQIWL